MNELPLITVSLFSHLQLFNRSHTSGAYGKFNTNYLPYMDNQALTCLHADPFTFPLNANLSIAGLINHQKAPREGSTQINHSWDSLVDD